MNRVFSLFVKFVSIALLASSAFASDDKPTAAADANQGGSLYANGDASRGVMACVACHGNAGNSTITQNPKLAGQHAAYLQKQLLNFTTPERNNAVMTAIAKGLTEADMRNLAAYLEQQKPAPGAAKNKSTVELGKKIYRGGIAEKNVPACASCHGPNGAGIPAQFARVAGQHQDYTSSQLTGFRSGVRMNSAQMMTISKRLSDDEIAAVSDYIAGLK